MPQHYSRNELVDMLLAVGRADENFNEAARFYMRRFPNRRHPNAKVLRRLLVRFRETGTVNYKKPIFLNPAVCNDENKNLVMQSIIENPHCSTRNIARQLNMSQTSVSRIIRKNKFHPYKMIVHQELTANDHGVRIQFAEWGLQKLQENPFFFQNVLFTDEATFKNDGSVVRHNMHYYSDVNPHWIRQHTNQHRWSLNVWCGIIRNRVVGPIFIQDRLHGDNYLALLQGQIEDAIDNLPLDLRINLWWQHDGAPAHYALLVQNFLNNNYGNCWIGRGGPITWPPRSPDMTPLDYFLWGYIKCKAYEVEPTTPENMQQRIHTIIREIDENFILRAILSLRRRLDMCIQKQGHHFESFL